ncbi:hypothetical protein [Mesorhizobium sp. CN2-181]|uniref:hypothetical protein n=1 Tax=Mesorhizobium yinganensis TaxID=3157707 RepID=UPI0032B72E78
MDTMPTASILPYIYRWDRHSRKDQACVVTARGKMNSIRVEFADGYIMVTSGNAIRRRKPCDGTADKPITWRDARP